MTPEDLRHVRPTGDDAFQIMSREFSGWLLVVGLIVCAMLEKYL